MAKAKLAPWDAPPLDADERRAFQALRAGKASETQQLTVVNVLLLKLARLHAQPFVPGPDGDRATAFACGRRFVGERIMNAFEGPIPEK